MPKKEETEHSSLLYMKVSSLEDLCRYVCKFDSSAGNLLLSKDKGGSKIIAIGEQVGNAMVAYYFPMQAKTKTLKYIPGNGQTKESAEFVEKAEHSAGVTLINIIGINLLPFSGTPKITDKDLSMMNLDTSDDLIRAVIKKAMDTDRMPDVYCIERKGKRYLCAFGIIEELENDRKLFYYSLFNSKMQASFAKYTYSENRLEFTQSMGDHTSMYVKIINLAEPFPFFNMPE